MPPTIRDRVKSLRRVKASDLIENPKNWRRHPPKQRAALQAALAEIGFADVCLVRETPAGLVVIDGHLRRDICGDRRVPVLVTDLNEEEADKLLATLDPLAAMAETDIEKLGVLASELGWEAPELESLVAGLLPQADATQDEAPSLNEAPTRAAVGDVWACGRHRVACGDACSGADVGRLLGDARPNLMVTDPPYGVNYDPAWRRKVDPRWSYREGRATNDDRADWTEAYGKFPGDVAYVWHSGIHGGTAAGGLKYAGFLVRAQIIWRKQSLVMSRGAYHWQHEPCWYSVRDGKKASWIGGRKQSTIWDVPNVHPTQGVTDDAVTDHGDQKPVECMARPIRNHEGDVYDPFVGSGTTVIAAQQLDRTCYAMDIEPKYVDVTLERWERFTGEKAKKL